MDPSGPTPNRHRRRVTAVAVVIVIAMGTLVGVGSIRTPTARVQVTFAGAAGAPLPATIRVASFNIHSGINEQGRQDLPLTARTIEGLDIVAMQEVAAALLAHDQARELAQLTGLQPIFLPA